MKLNVLTIAALIVLPITAVAESTVQNDLLHLSSDYGQANVTLSSSDVVSSCIDLNTASRDQLIRITHIGNVRVENVIAGRPWASVKSLTAILGIGSARIRDI